MLRGAYDLAATKPGGLLLHLGPENAIESIEYDDAGPAWDCSDDDSSHWVAINKWANDTLNAQSKAHGEPMGAASVFYAYWLGEHPNLNARSHGLLRDWAMDQWQQSPATKAAADAFFPADCSFSQWLHRARYFSEALVLERTSPTMDFAYKGVSFNSNCMLPWLVFATFEEEKRHSKPLVDGQGTVYSSARVQHTQERVEALYDWRVCTRPDLQSDLFSGPCHARIVMQPQSSMFNSIRINPSITKMSALERVECIKRIYDIVSGHDIPLTPEQAYAMDCERLVFLKNNGSIDRMGAQDVAHALRVIADKWWAEPGSQGRVLLDSVQSLYPWEQMKKSTPNAALGLLADMGALSARPDPAASWDADGASLFDPN